MSAPQVSLWLGAANVCAASVSAANIPDVEVAAFKVMLSFIYTEELSELNGDNAMAVLYAAMSSLHMSMLSFSTWK
ncbi:hypothetical protein niasHS_016171 [Heterodera schachtii]|uniref:BTB domain-containing protein n=2 Tax=Heterodera TaxID=34509 RepID=A0ABD2I478_HETSC